MDWAQVIAGILSSAIIAALGKWLGIKADDAQRAKLDWALEKGIAAAAERFGKGQGGQKKELAIQVAESLAPKAMKELDQTQKSVLIDATVARLRPSLPGHTTFVTHGDALEHQSEQVVLPPSPSAPARPTPLPPLRRPIL